MTTRALQPVGSSFLPLIILVPTRVSDWIMFLHDCSIVLNPHLRLKWFTAAPIFAAKSERVSEIEMRFRDQYVRYAEKYGAEEAPRANNLSPGGEQPLLQVSTMTKTSALLPQQARLMR